MRRRDLQRAGICLVCLSDNPDHQEVVYSLHHELTKRGFRAYTVGIVNPKTPFAGRGGSNFYVNCPKRPGLAKGTFNVPDLVRAIKVIRAIDASFVYFETVHAWNLPLELAIRRRSTVLEVVHDVNPHDGSRLTSLASRWCALMADYTVIRNNMDIDLCTQAFGIPSERVLALESWRAFPLWQAPRHTGVFLFFGRLRKYKGLQALLKIAETLSEFDFRVVGKSDKESLVTVRELSLLQNVKVEEGFVDPEAMEEAFSNADWVIVPYESASQSGIIMDACRYSRPVIAFDVGAISEQVEDGTTGYLVKKGDLNGFIAAMRRAKGLNAAQLEAKSKAAYEFGVRKYSAKGAADRFVNMIEGIDW